MMQYRIVQYDEIDSTNLKVTEEAYRGAGEGLVVVAEKQTAGRGRRGRNWESPAGKNLYFSLLLTPNVPVERISMLTLVMAHAVARGIKRTKGGDKLSCGIKWPNDIVVNSRKVCGILTELHLEGRELHHVVIGVGINVKHQKFSGELVDKATDLETECGQQVDRKELFAHILEAFGEDYEKYIGAGSLAFMREEYEALLVNKDREVCVLEPAGQWKGVAKGITDTGELVVELPDGSLREVYAGEVTVRGIYGYV